MWRQTWDGGGQPADGHCDSCGLLGVFGENGSRHAPAHPKIALIDEAPYSRETTPLSGAKGKLLTGIIRDLGLTLEDVAILYACECPVERGKKPTMDQMRCCLPRLMGYLLEANPTVIMPMGKAVSQLFLGGTLSIAKRRGVYWFGFLPTLRPNAVLKEPLDYQDLVHDITLAARICDGYKPIALREPEDHQILEYPGGVDAWIDEVLAEAKMPVAIDLETTGLDFMRDEITLMGFCWQPPHVWSIQWADLTRRQAKHLGEVLREKDCVFQNGQFDAAWLMHRGVDLHYAWDTLLAHFLLDERKKGHDLETLAVRYLEAYPWKSKFIERQGRDWMGKELDGDFLEDLYTYNCLDVDYTRRLVPILKKELKADGLTKTMDEIVMPAARHFTELKLTGLKIDVARLSSYEQDLDRQINRARAVLTRYEGAADVDFESPTQVAEYLYDHLKLIPFGGPYPEGKVIRNIPEHVIQSCTEGVDDPEAQEYWHSKRAAIIKDEETDGLSSRATSAYMLWWLAQQHAFPRDLLKYRNLTKRRTYAKRIRDNLCDDDRVRPQYWLSESKTGRLSTTNPAIHNLPRGDEIYDIFVADEGCTLIYADYSQMELRVAAHLSDDDRFIELLSDPTVDIHTGVALQLWNMELEDYLALPKDVQRERRTGAKGINFGILYGRTAKGLAPQLGVSPSKAAKFINEYFARFPQLKEWIAEQQALVRTKHEVTSIFGRKRRFDMLKDQTHIRECQRQAVNMPVQSAASDICLLAHMRAVAWLREAGIRTQIWPHIHDSITVQVPTRRLKAAVRIVREAMLTLPFPTRVPFAIDLKTGPSWGELEEWVD